MEENRTGRGINALLTKYKYPVLILLAGMALMLLPTGTAEPEQTVPVQTAQAEDLEQALEAVLSRIEGAGEVRVLLTEESGRQTLYQTDTQADTDEAGSRHSADTVLVSDDSRSETGLVRQVLEPVYRGAVVVCRGADSPSVRLAIVEAVRCATGLRTDQISVLKMK